MKKIVLLLSVLAIASLTYVGCSVSKDFSFGIDKDFVANNYQSLIYTRSDTVDARASSSDFDKYKSDLQTLDIQSATYMVTNFSGSSTQKITSATLSVSDVRGGSPVVLATITNVSLLSEVGLSHDLPLSDAGKQFFKDQLMGSASAAILTLSATTNQTPITFTIRLHFDIKATYEKSFP
jgi:hypothetical protein